MIYIYIIIRLLLQYKHIHEEDQKTGKYIKHITPAKHDGFVIKIMALISSVGGAVLMSWPPPLTYRPEL